MERQPKKKKSAKKIKKERERRTHALEKKKKREVITISSDNKFELSDTNTEDNLSLTSRLYRKRGIVPSFRKKSGKKKRELSDSNTEGRMGASFRKKRGLKRKKKREKKDSESSVTNSLPLNHGGWHLSYFGGVLYLRNLI